MKMCTTCGVRVAVLPDRNVMGRPIKRLCKECHMKRLSDDIVTIIKQHLKEEGELV